MASATLLLGGFMVRDAVGQAPEAPNPRIVAIVRKAIRASRTQSLVGTRTVEFRDGSVNPRHTEIVTRSGQNVRIDFPPGTQFAGQIIVDNGIDRRHYFPRPNEIRILPSRKDEIIRQLTQLVGRAGIKRKWAEESPSTVAGRSVSVISVADLDGNVVQRLYLDSETSFPLKRVLYDPVGAPIGSFEFTHVDFQAVINPALFKLDRKGATIVSPQAILARLTTRGGFERWQIPVTSGFRLEGSHVANFDGTMALVQVYSSANGKVSFFQVKSNVIPNKLRQSARLDFSVWVWKPKQSTLILIGPRRGESLSKIADSVEPGPSGQ